MKNYDFIRELNNVETYEIESDYSEMLNTFFIQFVKNLEIIKKILESYDFQFNDFDVIISDKNDVISYSNEMTLEDLNIIKEKYKIQGYIPFSFKTLFHYIEQIDFRGYFKDIDLEFQLDSLTIMPLQSIMEYNDDSGLYDLFQDDETGKTILLFSYDEYTKENISGEMGYGIPLSQNELFDDFIVDYKERIPFLSYLNKAIYYGCFPNLAFIDEKKLPLILKKYLTDVRNSIT